MHKNNYKWDINNYKLNTKSYKLIQSKVVIHTQNHCCLFGSFRWISSLWIITNVDQIWNRWNFIYLQLMFCISLSLFCI